MRADRVVHACDSDIWEAEVGGFQASPGCIVGSRLAWSLQLDSISKLKEKHTKMNNPFSSPQCE